MRENGGIFRPRSRIFPSFGHLGKEDQLWRPLELLQSLRAAAAMVAKAAWLSLDEDEDDDVDAGSNDNDDAITLIENEGEPSPSSGAAGAAASSSAAAAAAAATGGSGLPPPFLTKTYEMIDDTSTNAVVSWSSKGSSFVVWNSPELSKDLLPKYFKHNNFSSFVRQLNTYGFRKVDPDRWEFANEGFLRGQKHLLKNIHRRKPSATGHQNHSQGGGAAGESNRQKLEAEIEKLNRDKNVLMLELVRMRQQQQETERELQAMGQRVHGTELRQQHMVSFLVRAIQSPGVLAHLVQQSRGGARIHLTEEDSRKRKLLLDHHDEGRDGCSNSAAPSSEQGGQIVSYDPHESTRAKLIEFFSSPDLPSKLEAPLEILVRELIPQTVRGDPDEEAECQSSRGTSALQAASSEISSRDNSSPSVVTDMSNSNNNFNSSSSNDLYRSSHNCNSNTPESLVPPNTPPLLNLVLEVKQPDCGGSSGLSSTTTNVAAARKPLEGEMNASVDSGAVGVGINDVFWEKFLTEDAAQAAANNPGKPCSKSPSAPWWARIKP